MLSSGQRRERLAEGPWRVTLAGRSGPWPGWATTEGGILRKIYVGLGFGKHRSGYQGTDRLVNGFRLGKSHPVAQALSAVDAPS
jgi:hypothetical protein